MKRAFFVLLFFLSSLFSVHANEELIDSSFITKFEYGAMLYRNPRGIGCNKCHAKGDKSVVIAIYKDNKGKTHSIKAPPISKLTYQTFEKKLNAKNNRSYIMPTYFLTKKEINSIYHYISNLNK